MAEHGPGLFSSGVLLAVYCKPLQQRGKKVREATQYERRAALPPHAWKGRGLRAACMMNLIDESLEWRSVLVPVALANVASASRTVVTPGQVAVKDRDRMNKPV